MLRLMSWRDLRNWQSMQYALYELCMGGLSKFTNFEYGIPERTTSQALIEDN